MSDDRAVNVAPRLKRDVAIHRVAQVLADATACRAGEQPRGLSQLPTEYREWFKRTARSLVEIYEQMTGVEPPAAETKEPDVFAARSSQGQVLILRQHGRDQATERGHDMSVYRPMEHGHETSSCRKCSRVVVINFAEAPSISGSAIDEGCISTARPDAFLSEQPEAGRDGDR